jgi:hypothetical protein
MPGSNPSRRPIACRHCSAALTTLQRLRGDCCDRAECRRRATVTRLREQRDADLAATRAAAARRDAADPVAQVPVVWLAQHRVRLAPLPAARRQAYREHLESLATTIESGVDVGTAGTARSPDPDPPAASVGATLCGFCAGRCCRLGADHHAFITADLLRRWLAENPGRRPADAVAQYMALLPHRHAENSCVNHGPEGCTLPRALRSDICNQFVCAPLSQVLRASDSEPPQTTLLAAMEGSHQITGVALLQPDGLRRVPLKRRRKRAGKA